MGCGCDSCGTNQRSKMQKHVQKKTGIKSVSLPNAKGMVMKVVGKRKKKPY